MPEITEHWAIKYLQSEYNDVTDARTCLEGEGDEVEQKKMLLQEYAMSLLDRCNEIVDCLSMDQEPNLIPEFEKLCTDVSLLSTKEKYLTVSGVKKNVDITAFSISVATSLRCISVSAGIAAGISALLIFLKINRDIAHKITQPISDELVAKRAKLIELLQSSRNHEYVMIATQEFGLRGYQDLITQAKPSL